MDKIFVTKANGTKQLFEREKIVRTCLRMGATQEIAKIVAKSVEKQVYDAIETRKILQMLSDLSDKYNPQVIHVNIAFSYLFLIVKTAF